MPNQLAASAILKQALLKLAPTGPNGFEGLLAAVLSDITNQPFRLADSGLQGGRDGEGPRDEGHIAFEAKLYKSRIPRNEVLGKIADIAASLMPPDLWVLGATTMIGTQLQSTLDAVARKDGVATLILDWPSAAKIAPLAVLCASAPQTTCDFLSEHVAEPTIRADVDGALQALRAAPAFTALAETQLRALLAPTIGTNLASEANRDWFRNVFSHRRRAKSVFGQPLTPLAPGSTPFRARTTLTASVAAHFATHRPGKIVALLGPEGAGKSWLFAETWLTLSEAPLTIWISASDVKSPAGDRDIVEFLVDKLIAQTGDGPEPHLRERWKRRFGRWMRAAPPTKPNLVVCVDGLNQHPAMDWPRWLDAAAEIIDQFGGALIVTARASYFNDRVRPGLESSVVTIPVPEWSQAELAEILRSKNVGVEQLDATVKQRLENPRLLAVALDLLDSASIRDFTELTIERLLFEHIRTGAREGFTRESVKEFAHRLSRHALDVIDRIRRQERDERLVFERAANGPGHRLSADLLAVGSEQFFHPLPYDPTLYSLTEHGFSLALGLAIITSLRRAEHDHRDVAEALDELLDPIAALDRTAEAVLSAVLVAAVDPDCSTPLKAALIGGFIKLQNVAETAYPPFVGAISQMVDPALDALAQAAASQPHAAQLDWLTAALRDLREKPELWRVVSTRIKQWLGVYSLSPELSIPRYLSDPEKVAEAERDSSKRLQGNWGQLTLREADFFAKSMTKSDEADPARLRRVSYDLLAGAPLADFAEAFVAASLSEALNSSLRSPYDEQLALLRFNTCDWAETRDALLAASAFLREPNVSTTARWALVAILRGLATDEDARAEDELVTALTRDLPPGRAWRRVETYCATDPCDPSSSEPDNLAATAEKYRELDPEALAKSVFVGMEDHVLRDARLGLARFRPEAAIGVHEAFARSALARQGPELRRAVHTLDHHSAVLDRGSVDRLLTIARDLSSPANDDGDATEEAWTISQSALVVAFPHLDGEEQLRTLMGLPPHGSLLINLGETFRPASEELLDQAFEAALLSGEPNRKCAALFFARRSGTPVSPRARQIIGQFAIDSAWVVRSEAMSTIVKLDDASLIQAVVDSGWSARGLDHRKQLYELHNGSTALVRAAELDFLTVDALLGRISPTLFGAAAALGPEAAASIAERLHAAVRTAISFEPPFTPPFTQRRVKLRAAEYPPDLEMAQRSRTADTLSDFRRDQKEGWASFDKFDAALTEADARLIVEDFSLSVILTCVGADLTWGRDLAKLVLQAPASRLWQVRNFGLKLARALSGPAPAVGASLIERLGDARGFTTVVYGASKISLLAMCVWGGDDNPMWDRLRFARLDRAQTDKDIAQEVLAALLCGKTDRLTDYVKTGLDRPEPAANARALMVLGFGEPSELADRRLAQHRGAPGFLGKAAASATYAYERNQWAKHWFSLMATADDPHDHWRYGALFLKIVDGRYEVWDQTIARTGKAAAAFEPGLVSEIGRRIRSWGDKREKTLAGETAPPASYIQHA